MTGFVSDMRRSGNGLLVRVSMIAAIGGLLFGYDTGVISGALLYIKDDLHAGAFAQQAIVSGLLLGAMLGAVLSGYLADAISRKWTKVLSGSVYVLGALGCAFSVNAPIRDEDPDADVDGELDDIQKASEQEGTTRSRDLLSRRVRPLLIIGLGLALFQQFVGINTVIYYAPTILADTGLTKSSSITQTVFVGITNVVFTVIAVLLLDRVGRRKLLLTGTAGLILSLVLLGIYFTSSTLQQQAGYLALVALLIFIASFAIGLGPVFWLMISEIYPVGIRSKAMSVSTVANWGGNFLVAATFLSLGGAITRQGTFYLYAGIAVLALIFFLAKVPETKDRTLEEIQDDLTDTDTTDSGRLAKGAR